MKELERAGVGYHGKTQKKRSIFTTGALLLLFDAVAR